MSNLYNKYSKEDLKSQRDAEGMSRRTLSFYRYVRLENLEELRANLYRNWETLAVLGRVYIASEGINAQISVPESNWEQSHWI